LTGLDFDWAVEVMLAAIHPYHRTHHLFVLCLEIHRLRILTSFGAAEKAVENLTVCAVSKEAAEPTFFLLDVLKELVHLLLAFLVEVTKFSWKLLESPKPYVLVLVFSLEAVAEVALVAD